MGPIHPFGFENKTAMDFCYNIFGSSLRSIARQIIPFRKPRGKKRDQINKETKGNGESLH